MRTVKRKSGVIIGAASGIVAIGIVSLFLIHSNHQGVDQVYLLPNHFKGCVVIRYNRPDAPPLQIKHHQITYKVPRNGLIKTSSPMTFGWINKQQSGAFQEKAYYVNKKGHVIKQLPQDDMLFGATGQDSHGDLLYKYFVTQNGHCPTINNP